MDLKKLLSMETEVIPYALESISISLWPCMDLCVALLKQENLSIVDNNLLMKPNTNPPLPHKQKKNVEEEEVEELELVEEKLEPPLKMQSP